MKRLFLILVLLFASTGCLSASLLDKDEFENDVKNYATKTNDGIWTGNLEDFVGNLYCCDYKNMDSTGIAKFAYIDENHVICFYCDKQGENWYRVSNFFETRTSTISLSLDFNNIHLTYNSIMTDGKNINMFGYNANNECINDVYSLFVEDFDFNLVKDIYHPISFNPSVSDWN